MIKTKLSKQNLTDLNKFEQKLQQINKIETSMYERIKKNQLHTLTLMQQKNESKKRCLKQRPMNMKAQTFQQIIKHPANDTATGGNGTWMYLANFIQQIHDLSAVEKRMLQRQQIREQIQKRKEQERLRQQQRLRRQKQQRQYEERIRSGKGFGSMERRKKEKVPFNLQRELHRREVQENRKRLEKMEEYKRQAYYEKKL